MAAVPPAFSSLVTPLQLRLRDIQAFQLPRLTAGGSAGGGKAGPSPSSLTAETLSSYEGELNDALDECFTLIEEGEWLVRDLIEAGQLDSRSEEIITTEWERAKSGYASARTSSRSALLTARKTLAEQKRAGLLGRHHREQQQQQPDANSTLGPHSSVRQQQKMRSQKTGASSHTGDDAALVASSELTSSLQNALGLLSDSLSQSTLSTQLLEESTSTLSTLSLSYTSFTDLLKNSSGIIKSMETQDRWDALMLLGAYLFFAVCIAYILKVRIWDRGLKVLMILLRLGGIRSREDVKEKMELAKEAARSDAAKSAARKVTETIANVAAAAVTTSTAAVGPGVVQSAPEQEQLAVGDLTAGAAVESGEPEVILDKVQEILDRQQGTEQEAAEMADTSDAEFSAGAAADADEIDDDGDDEEDAAPPPGYDFNDEPEDTALSGDDTSDGNEQYYDAEDNLRASQRHDEL